MHAPSTSAMFSPGGSGFPWASTRPRAPPSPTPATSMPVSSPVRPRAHLRVPLRHTDPHRMDDVPAVTLRVSGPVRRLDTPEGVAGAGHESVRPGLRVPRKLPPAPGVPVLLARQRSRSPRLPAVDRDVDADDGPLAGPS